MQNVNKYGRGGIRPETEASLSLLEKAVTGAIIITSLSALLYENNQNPFDEHRERILSYLSIASKLRRYLKMLKIRQKTLTGSTL